MPWPFHGFGKAPAGVLFEDDFNYVGNPDPTKWIVGRGNPQCDGSELTLISRLSPGADYVYSIMDTFQYKTLETRANMRHSGTKSQQGFGFTNTPSYYVWAYVDAAGKLCLRTVTALGYEHISLPAPSDDYHIYKIVWTPGSAILYVDGIPFAATSNPNYVPDTPSNVTLYGVKYGGTSEHVKFDWMKVY